MIEETKYSIRQILQAARNPIVAWSGGRDSMLLLHLTREIQPDIAIVWFKQNVSREWERWCESIIVEWDLQVFTYPASDTYYLPNDQGLTLIDEYSFGLDVMPVLTDVSDDVECGAKVNGTRVPSFSYPWDATLTGYRASDRHSILGSNFFPEDGTQCGNTKLFAPMRWWADTDVERVSRGLNLPQPPEDDTLHRCTNCLQPGDDEVFCSQVDGFIPRLKWDSVTALANFRTRFVPQFQ